MRDFGDVACEGASANRNATRTETKRASGKQKKAADKPEVAEAEQLKNMTAAEWARFTEALAKEGINTLIL
jgi:hypothetical protein